MIGDLVVGLLGALLGGGGDGSRKLRRAFAAGEPVTFPACLAGDLPYCRSTVGFLTASRHALVASPTRVPTVAPRRLPVERLELLGVRPRRKDDPRQLPRYWHVAECRDGAADVLIACSPRHLDFVTPLLGRPPVAP